MGLPAIMSMIIHLGCRLPDTSSDLPGGSCGPHSSTSLFGLAPGGVYPASPVTRRTGALLPHRFTLTPSETRRFAFCCTCLRVTATPRYGAPCPSVFGLSSGPSMGRRSSGLLRPLIPILLEFIHHSLGIHDPLAMRAHTDTIHSHQIVV